MKENYKNIIKTKSYESPCGILLLGAFHDKLCLCDWQVEKHRDHVDKRLKRVLHADFEYGTTAIIEKAIVQLDEFFAGERKDFAVPYTNNKAERGCRKVKTKKNVSGQFVTKSGADAYASIISVIQTARENGENALEAIEKIMK